MDATAVWAPDRNAQELLQMGFRQHQVAGSCPFVQVLVVSVEIDLMTLVDNTWSIVRRFTIEDRAHSIHLQRADVHLLLTGTSLSTHVEIAAPTWEDVIEVRAQLEPRLQVTKPIPAASTSVRMWHRGQPPSSTLAMIKTPPWNEVRHHYPAKVAASLDQLMHFHPPDEQRGRLILWHGAAGTGKTTAIRSLIRSWRDQCSAHSIIDPEEFFRDPGYMSNMLSSRHPDMWKLIIAEDSDRFLMADSGGASTGSIGQLLSLTDGLLGQGSNTLVLITTNLDIRRVHPALVRPGRCLSNIEFTRLSPTEATRISGIPCTNSMTLAEAFEARTTGHITETTEHYGYV